MGRSITFELLTRSTKQAVKRDEEPREFLRRLTHLTLQDKSIDELSGLEDVTNLQTLYAYDNIITAIGGLQNNRFITHLYLQNNRISVMENLSHLGALTKLHIGGNYITIVDGLEGCTSLEELSIEKQRCNTELRFHPNSLRALGRSLQVLICSHNRMGYDTQACISPLVELQGLRRLDLSSNDIDRLDVGMHALLGERGCRGIERLDLRNNALCRQHKYREAIIVMSSPQLRILDDKDILQHEREFLTKLDQKLSRIGRKGLSGPPEEQPEIQMGMEMVGAYLGGNSDEQPLVPRPPLPAGGRKPLASIQSENPGQEQFRGGGNPGIDREAEKRRLQLLNQFNGDIPQVKPREKPEAAAPADDFNTVMAEIEERKKFLDSMVAMGQGHLYEKQIAAEISQRIAVLERIDKKRAAETSNQYAQELAAQAE